MSYNVQHDSGASFETTLGTFYETHEEALLGIHYDSEAIVERWPQLARGYCDNDFTMVRATVAGEWDTIDHDDLHVDPDEYLREE
ncbi:hypothetical protein [Haloarchaeobius sp. DYHT-AS-18]|uniref:hypothetical protein n=1 Tax=Haloarchaeobius sp. DYHT-AS-18 TaxID=3446117 RepID=UPI003EBE08BB